MPNLIINILCILALLSPQQTHLINGKVIDGNTKQAISNVLFQTVDSTEGFYTLPDGSFSFPIDNDSHISLLCSSLGYIPKLIKFDTSKKDSVIIELFKKPVLLNEVHVSATKKRKIRKGVMGKENLKLNGAIYGATNSEIGIFLEPQYLNSAILEQVCVYVTKEGFPRSKFRLHVYDIDTSTLLPVNDITDSNLIVQADSGNSWKCVDLSARKIHINGPICISVEWINHVDNPKESFLRDASNRCYISLGYGQKYNNQVIGLTYSYGLQNITIDKNEGEWFWMHPLGKVKKRNGIFFTDHWFNPMIYATYRYAKK